ncbi:MAG TPA: hypothetical protein DCX07_16425 [Phycisphaerales bacterium]|nr:hypothetical protein [Phycisphaerales bacterium]
MGYVICFVVMLALAFVIVAQRKTNKDAAPPAKAPAETMPFRRNKYFLSTAEQSFYGVLKHAVAGQQDIFAKVRLLDLLWLPPQAKNKQRYRNLVQSKHVDFVLCDPKSLQPLLAIELDDSSHGRDDRGKRDELVDKVLADAALPILHVPAKSAYDPRQLTAGIQQALGAKPQAAAMQK